jgi:hypothetical protein
MPRSGRSTDTGRVAGPPAQRRFATPTGAPCPRTVRLDGAIDGDGACHACGMGLACPLLDPWADPSDFADVR